MKVFINNGADCSKMKGPKSPLYFLVINSSVTLPMIKMVVEKGGEQLLTLVDEWKHFPAESYLQNKRLTFEIFEFLWKKMGEMSINHTILFTKDEIDLSILDWVYKESKSKMNLAQLCITACERLRYNTKVIDWLFSKGLSYMQFKNETSPIQVAAKRFGAGIIVRHLMEITGVVCSEAFTEACGSGNEEVVIVFLAYKRYFKRFEPLSLSLSKNKKVQKMISSYNKGKSLWRTERHHLFPTAFQKCVLTFILFNKQILQKRLRIPKPLLKKIIKHI